MSPQASFLDQIVSEDDVSVGDLSSLIDGSDEEGFAVGQAAKEKIESFDLSPDEGREAFKLSASIYSDQVSGKSPDPSTQLGQDKLDLLEAIAEDRPLSRTQGAALAVISILPMLIGGAVKGKRGVVAGAEAGVLGASILEKDRQRKEAQRDRVDMFKLKRQIAREDSVAAAKAKEAERQVRRREGIEDFRTKRQIMNQTRPPSRTADAIGRLAGSVEKALDVRLKTLKLQAAERGAASERAVHQVGADVFFPDNVSDENLKKAASIRPKYKKFGSQLSEIYRIVNANTATGRVVGKDADRLSKLVKDARITLADIKAINGKLNNSELRIVEEIVSDPSAPLANIVSALNPLAATQKDKVDNIIDIIESDYRSALEGMGFNSRFRIGQVLQKGNDSRIIVGYGADPETGVVRPLSRPATEEEIRGALGG